jgi:hypothetical protein
VPGRTITCQEQDPSEFAWLSADLVGVPAAQRVAATCRWVFAGADRGFYDVPRAGDSSDAPSVTSTPLHIWITAQPWKELAR